MRTKRLVLALAVLAALAVVSVWRYATLPRLEHHKVGSIHAPQGFQFGSVTVVFVEPGSAVANIDWKGYNTRTGGALRMPFEELRIELGDERYVISDRAAGVGGVRVNGKLLKIDAHRQQLAIRVGVGFSAEPRDDSVATWGIGDAPLLDCISQAW